MSNMSNLGELNESNKLSKLNEYNKFGNCLFIDRLLCKCDSVGMDVRVNFKGIDGYCRKCKLVIFDSNNGNNSDIIGCDFIHPRNTQNLCKPKTCSDNQDIRKDIGNYVCIKCGTYKGPVFDLYHIFDYFVRKKAVHDRIGWFRNMIVDYVKDCQDQELLTADFQLLVRTYEKHNLVKGRNMSVYGY